MPKRIDPNKEELDRIIVLYSGGMSYKSVSKETGFSAPTIEAILKRNGIKTRSLNEGIRQSFRNGRKVASYWKGKKQPPEMVQKRAKSQSGPNHYLWKGGLSTRPYRKLIRKDRCEICGTKNNLHIHHIDFDHYNNSPDNLQVLCLSHHLSLHKKEYWKAKRENRIPKKSTAPSHWKDK